MVNFLSLTNTFLAPIAAILRSLSRLVAIGACVSGMSRVLSFAAPRLSRSSSLRLSKPPTSVGTGRVSFQCDTFRPLYISNLSVGIGHNSHVTVMKPDNSNGDALLGLLSKVLCPCGKAIAIGSISGEGFGQGSLYHCITCSSRSSSLFSNSVLRGVSLGRSLSGASCLGLGSVYSRLNVSRLIPRDSVNLCAGVSGKKDGMSNNRGRQVVLTHTLFSRTRFLLLSRPADTLSDLSRTGIFSCLSQVSGAVIIMTRHLRAVHRFSGVFIVSGKSIIRSNARARLLTRNKLCSGLCH